MTEKKRNAAAILSAAAVAVLFSGCSEKPAEKIDTRPLVRVGAVSNGVCFTDSLAVQGMIRAKDVASISARLPGTIDAICVEEGATVKKGETLFKVDQVNLANAVRAAGDDLAMAKAKHAQTEATCAKAQLDLGRMTRLLETKAVTRDAFEKAEVSARSMAAALEAAKATVTKAETGLSVARKNLADSEVRAPFEAVVTKKLKNAGDYVGPGAKVFELENPATYELCLSLNAAQYGRVSVGKTEIEITPPPSTLYPLTYKSTSVNPLTRTFEVRAVIPKTESLASGMLVDCRIVFVRRTGQAVPATAVAYRGGGDCVFKVVDGKVARVPVVAGLSANGLREIVSPKLSPDDMLIVEGQLLVNDGDEVRIVSH